MPRIIPYSGPRPNTVTGSSVLAQARLCTERGETFDDPVREYKAHFQRAPFGAHWRWRERTPEEICECFAAAVDSLWQRVETAENRRRKRRWFSSKARAVDAVALTLAVQREIALGVAAQCRHFAMQNDAALWRHRLSGMDTTCVVEKPLRVAELLQQRFVSE